MTLTVYSVESIPTADFLAKVEKRAERLKREEENIKTAEEIDRDIQDLREHPMDWIEPYDCSLCLYEGPSFLKARQIAMRGARKDWFGVTRLIEQEIDDTLPLYDRERTVREWECQSDGITPLDLT